MSKRLLVLLTLSLLVIRAHAQDEPVDDEKPEETTVAAAADETQPTEQNAEEVPADGGGGGTGETSVAPPEQTENDAEDSGKTEDSEQPSGGEAETTVKPDDETVEPSEKPAEDSESPNETTEPSEKPAESTEPSEKPSDNNESPSEKPDESTEPSEKPSNDTETTVKPSEEPSKNETVSEKPSESNNDDADDSSTNSTSTTTPSSNENTTKAEFDPYFHITSPQSTEPEYQPVGSLIESSTDMPWRAFFRFNNSKSRIYCGGAILTRYKIITTASCLYDNETKELYTEAVVMAGGIRINAFSYKERIDLETQAIVFPQYNVSDPYMNHNLAIITLLVPLSFTSSVNNIEISSVPTDTTSKLYLSGFGRSSNGDPYVEAKRHRVKLVNIAVCRSTFGPNVCTANVLSTVGEFTKLASICRVESGAPLTYHPGWFRKPLLIGLASFVSDQGCLTGNPDGYVYVARYLYWIREILLL